MNEKGCLRVMGRLEVGQAESGRKCSNQGNHQELWAWCASWNGTDLGTEVRSEVVLEGTKELSWGQTMLDS